MNSIPTVLLEILGQEPGRVTPLDSGNNDVLRVYSGSASYILKCFKGDRHRAYEREIGMRDCLRHFSHVEFPNIVGSAELGGNQYILIEDLAGERLDKIWSQDRTLAGKQMSDLGRMLGSIHEIPVAKAKRFLEQEDVLYTERYFAWMMDTMAPYLTAPGQTLLLPKCYETVVGTPVRETVIHGDFGPHQVIVDSQGQWNLIDFEYAALGPFADDLAGTEVRLEQEGYPNIEGFLGEYQSVRGALAEYEPVRSAYKAYNLLAMLTYRLAHMGEAPPTRGLEQLETLLASV